MKRPALFVAALIIAACLAAAVYIFILRVTPPNYATPHDKLRIGTSLIEASGLLWVAQDKGYFANNRLDAEIEIFEAGKYAVDALLESKVDVATAAEFVLASNAMDQQKIQAVGSIGKGYLHYIIGRKDRGIERPPDLKGKNIGITSQTISEFYLGRYLQLHGIDLDEIVIINVKLSRLEEWLMRGDVDAVLTWDPYAYAMEKKLGPKAVTWSAHSGRAMYWLLLCRHEDSSAKQELIVRLLKSLHQAELFLANHPDQGKKIVQGKLELETGYLDRFWHSTRLGLSLDQGLVIAMEDESRWKIETGPYRSSKLPYYPDYIYWQGLEKIDPSLVTLIR